MFPGKYESVVFLGMGGGNDVFSGILAAMCARAYGISWDRCVIAGVRSPFHLHDVRKTVYPGVGWVQPDSTRIVPRRVDPRRVSFVDATVARMLEEDPLCAGFRIDCVLSLSLERGSVGVAESLQSLAEQYAHIVLVDVGGDVFADGFDPHLLSPMFDAITLRGFLDSGVSGTMLEFGPGTDGEIEPERLREALRTVSGPYGSYPIPLAVMDRWEHLYKWHVAPVRTGNTVQATIDAYRSSDDEIRREYAARQVIGDMRRYGTFTQRINTALCRNLHVVDSKKIANPFAVRCDSALDWFVQTQTQIGPTNCEANLQYTVFEGRLLQLLTPSPLLSEMDRDDLLTHGLVELGDGICDDCWLWPQDWHRHAARFTGLTGNGRNQFIVVRKT